MPNWNLSVGLRGQGDHLVRTLRRSSMEARALARDVRDARREIQRLNAAARGLSSRGIRIRVTADGSTLRSEVQDAVRQAERGQRITVRVAADTSRLRQGAAATAVALDSLKDSAQSASRAVRGLGVNAALTATALGGLRDSARSASTSLRTLTTRAGDADGRLGGLSTRTRTLRSDMDDLDGALARVVAHMGGLRGRLGTVSTSAGSANSAMSKLRATAIALSPALLPIAAAAVPVAAQLGAAGAAVGAFGAAIIPQITRMTEAVEAHVKYGDAVREHGKGSKEAADAEKELQLALSKMSPAAREATAGFVALKDATAAWSNSLSSSTMPVFTKSFATLRAMLPSFTPLVEGAAGQMERLVTIAAGGVASPGFDRLIDRFNDFSTGALRKAVDGMVHFSRTAGGFDGGAFSEFLDYAKQNGPLVGETLRNLGAAVVKLLAAASDLGVSILGVVNAFAKLVNAIPTSLLSTLLQIYATFKLIKLAGLGLVAVAGGVRTLATQLLALHGASVAAGGGLAGLRAAFLSLSTGARIGVIAGSIAALALVLVNIANIGKEAPPDVDKLTTSLGKLGQTGKVSGEAARVLGKDMGKLAESLRGMARPGNLDKVQQWLTSLIGMDSTPVKEWKQNLDGADKALANLVKGGQADLAAAAFQHMADGMEKQGLTTKELRGQLDDYKSALADAAFEQELAAQAMGLFGQQAIATSEKLATQKASADGLRQAIQALNDVHRQGLGGMIGFEAAVDAAAKAAQENAGALSMSHGQLDLNSEKARNAATALNDLAAKTDEAAASTRESGGSWSEVNAIYERGRAELIKNAQALGLNEDQAKQLADQILKMPDKTTFLKGDAEDLKTKIAEAKEKLSDGNLPKSKRVKLEAEIKALEADLLKAKLSLKDIPDKKVRLRAESNADKIAESAKKALANVKDRNPKIKTSSDAQKISSAADRAIQNIRNRNPKIHASSNAAAVAAQAQRAINNVRDAYVTIYTSYKRATAKVDGGVLLPQADGGVVSYANGGMRERHVAQIARPGTWRVWAEPETQGEGYVPFARSKRVRSRAITEEIVRRLGGDPAGIQWNADGSVTDWRYDPVSGSLYSPSDAGRAAHKTRKVKGKEISYFDQGALEAKLRSNAKAMRAWNADLTKVAERTGSDVADALASMGEDGVKLARKMATGSKKWVDSMAKDLRSLAETARASLTDYTRQLGKDTAADSTFARDLATLAARGHGDLAAQLAAQNDEAAQQLASQAVKDNKKASSANAAAKKANAALTSDQVADLVQIIAAVKTSNTGIHDVAATTGLGEDVIIAIANKAKSQISGSLGSRATKFLADLARANRGLSYADGGIRPGLYAAKHPYGMVRWAEPETGGEAYIPLGRNKRRAATSVLAEVSRRFGLPLTDVQGSRPRVVVVREGAPLVGSQIWHVSSRGSAIETAREIEARDAYQLRRLNRGGVNR